VASLNFTETQRKHFFERVIVHPKMRSLPTPSFKIVIPFVASNPLLDLLIGDPAFHISAGQRPESRWRILRTMLPQSW
jgi:hypothetical protein